MPKFQLNNFQLEYLDDHPDNENTIVLLHGLGATCDSWAYQTPAFGRGGFRVISPSMRGFGHSGYPNKMSIPAMAADTATLIQSITDKPVHLLGLSMGGTVALQLAVDYPQLINKLILVNTFARLRPDTPSKWLYLLFRMLLIHTFGLEAQGKAVAGRVFPYPDQEEARAMFREQIEMANPRAYRASMRNMMRFNLLDQLPQIKSSTLVVTGGEDNTVPIDDQQMLADGIPQARRVTIENGGHAVPVDQPDAFNALVLGFLTDQN